MNSLAERIEIINSYKLLHESRSKIGSVLFYFYLVFTIALISTVLWSIINELTGFSSKLTWNKNSMSVLFSISILFNAVKGFYSNILLKHLNYLYSTIQKDFDESLNKELSKVIATNNKPLTNNVFIFSFAIIILIGVVTNFFMDEQFVYYKFFILPTLLFYFLTILDGVKTYRKLKANIDQVEKSQISNFVNL